MTPTIFVTAPRLAPSGVELLDQAQARVIYLQNGNDVQEVERIMASEPIDAVISRTVDLSATAIASCPTLKVISKHGVGVSNIDVDAATHRGIPVYVTPGANAQSVAEMTLGLMFAAARRIAWMDAELHAGRWSRVQDGIELHGKTLGLVGFGQIGQRVAAVCLALGMEVVAFDPGLKTSPNPAVRLVASVDEILPLADVLSLHVPLNKHTRGMLGAEQLARLPRGAIVVNTARGEVIDEEALIAALRSGQLYAAGLDTMSVEPLPAGHALAALPNVVLAPHVGGSTPAALAGMARGAARNVLGWLQGQPADPAACVNPQVLA
ncbi:D-3-phosphoglycerate dehydrogenase [Comamonas sp. BIGb0124]|uniref:hydroxyacid dehydrogenase n=1 Tax=Comamonas sp. BIGb0124 TaxID=2485130 RepID=UPI000F499025|nr:hydroxyacid dehydrogenase [Comamonas sp. BIGb0124]ROR22921.1 D-3-phosphoglycerate dehydrogenase [Comamonas sp. BIGb0124]